MSQTPVSASPATRIDSVDLLRGLIMAVMALDHVRDYFHAPAVHGADPLDLVQSTPVVFLTRWITHFCAPIFSFLAGIGVHLALARGKSPRQMSWFLVSRGAWLIFLELTLLMWFGWEFAIDWHTYYLATLWALGWSMILLAALIHVPRTVAAVLALAMIVGHNALDAVSPASWGGAGWIWQILHAGGNIAAPGGVTIVAFYPLIPWLGVMAAGYSLGAVFDLAAATRRRALLWSGVGLLLAFVLVRYANVYGDSARWSGQSNPLLTTLSFLKVTKYPPSLCYLLMTLGTGLVLLAVFERAHERWKWLLAFGRVPFFYYILHIPLIHALAWVANRITVGRANFTPISGEPPPDAGYNLAVTYLVWIGVVAALYFPCRWFADYKRRHRDVAWLSYF